MFTNKKKKGNKYGLLEENVSIDELNNDGDVVIELTDLNIDRNQNYYHQLPEKHHPISTYPHNPYATQGSQHPYISTEVVVHPKYISMNGISFVREDQNSKKSKVPGMIIQCSTCSQEQRVPGHYLQFECESCHRHNICRPIYGMFYCGKCRGKVCYQYGLSQSIRCTRCNTINKVSKLPPGGKQPPKIIDLKRQQKEIQESFCLFSDYEPQKPYFPTNQKIMFDKEIDQYPDL